VNKIKIQVCINARGHHFQQLFVIAQRLSERTVFQTKVVEKIRTPILGFNDFFPKNHAVSEIMWKNMVETDMPQMTIQGYSYVRETF
jgi:hypothetical protein